MVSSSSPTTTAEVAEPVAAERQRVDAALARFCERHLGRLERRVAEAIRYSLLGEGKRLRPLLALAAYRAAGGRGDATELAAALEVVHAYSLVHDDLPCMDDDDLRRGRPTTHRRFGVPVAMVAGVAMVPLAARCVHDAAGSLQLPRHVVEDILKVLVRAAGGGGMIGGQLLDLEAERRKLSLDELEHVHSAKTGALIAAAARIGGLAARASERQLRALDSFGAAIGLAFQIADDVLDLTATSDQLGKTAGRDVALAKSTYPALLGIDGANARARMLVAQGCEALAAAKLLTPQLEWLATYSVSRRS